MKRFQFDDIKRQFAARGVWLNGKVTYTRGEPEKPIIIRATAGRKDIKGRDFRVRGATGSDLLVADLAADPEAPPWQSFCIRYVNAEVLGENGEPAFEPVTDMTGRIITEGNFVCYSVSAGQNSHALEIGQVIRLSPTGTLTVARRLRNGNNVVTNDSYEYEGLIKDPNRAIKLPVERETMMMWMLRDFKDLGQDDDFGANMALD